jgi:hypothetical protein
MSDTNSPVVSLDRTVSLPTADPGITDELRWPPKSPGTSQDYSLDVSAWANDGNETITGFSAVVANAGSESTPLTAANQALVAGSNVCTVILAGGASPTDCAVTFTITTATRTLQLTVWIQVATLSATRTAVGLGVFGTSLDTGIEGQIATLSAGLASETERATVEEEALAGSLVTQGAAIEAAQSSIATVQGSLTELETVWSDFAESTGTSLGGVATNLSAESAARAMGDALNAAAIAQTVANFSAQNAENVLAHGAVGDGITDCTAAFSSAIAAALSSGHEVIVPGGDFKLTEIIAASGQQVAIRGQGKGITRIHIAHTGIALDIAPGALTNRVSIRDMSVYAENSGGQTAAFARITYAPTSSFGYVNVVIENVECFGYPNPANGLSPFPQTFRRGFILNGCWSPMVRDCSFFGPPSVAGATASALLEINGTNDTRLISPQIYYGQALVIQTGYCEGLYIKNPLVVGSDYVFYQTALTGWTGYVSGKTSLLGFWCYGGELNTALGHMKVNMLVDGFVAGCDITRDTGPSTPQVLFDFTDVSRFHFGPCDWSGGPGTSDVAIQFQASINSSGCSLLGGRFENMATCIAIVGASGTVGGCFTDFNIGNVPTATAIIDGSLSSNGNLMRFRTPATLQHPAGIGSVKDHLLTGPDGSPLFRVQSINGAANFWKVLPVTAGNPPVLLATGTDGTVNATIQTTGGNLYLSAAGDGVSGGLASFISVTSGSSKVTFTNAAPGNLVQIGTNADGITMNPVGSLYLSPQNGKIFVIGTLPTTRPTPGSNQLWNNGGVLSIA